MSHDQYGLPDIRQFMTGRSQYLPVMNQTPVVVEPFSVHHHPDLSLPTPHRYDSSGEVLCTTTRGGSSFAMDFGHHESVVGLELESGFGTGNGRWPRQETLTLLEIRSRLDFKFKEANQKGPLWDEVSRIMGEENGYHRSGKKCREKFENLYKYYKKTKEGKAGRQDGKHYRFFRQLEAIYGGSNSHPSSLQPTNLPCYTNNVNDVPLGNDIKYHNQEHKNISESPNEYSSELETSSSDINTANANVDDQDLSAIALMMSGGNNKSKARRGWKGRVKEFIDMNMRKLMETQEEWMERMLKAVEAKEAERMCEEEERRRRDAARIEQERQFWAEERAWLEARDVALVDALKKVSGGDDDLGAFCNVMEERSKKLKEDTRTYNYFHQLDLYNHHQQQQQQQQQGVFSRLRQPDDENENENERQMARPDQRREGNEGINMDANSNAVYEELWCDKFGLKLSNDKYH